MEKRSSGYKQSLHYDEEQARAVSEQITNAYQSGGLEREELHYQPDREVGE
ncbi:hypothetical protein [Anoxybacteroides tepidamans]|uniref:hypothetical protein n=1 Tax=Anoxybacteroides tepidamans TaxID=265948 RepID=UPI000A98AEDA|nr:hypothetical protein [Anoxybacillus tepidamans]